MTEVMVIQGRELHAEDIGLIRSLLAEHGDCCRTRIGEELCHRWDGHNAQGRCKDTAARTLLLKLKRAGHIQLPKRRGPSSNGVRNRNPPLVAHATEPHRVERCERCGRSLAHRPPDNIDKRQVHDLPHPQLHLHSPQECAGRTRRYRPRFHRRPVRTALQHLVAAVAR